MSAKSRKPDTESLGIESNSVLAPSRLQTGVLAFLDHILWPAHGVCRVRWCDLPHDQKIVQHPHRGELLLNGRFGSRKVLNPGSHMEWSYGHEFQAMSGAPVKKLPASPRVGSTSVPVTDRGSEEVNVGFSDIRAGRSNQLRDPRARRSAGND